MGRSCDSFAGWAAFIERQSRVILTRLGAGKTPSFDLFDMERWIRECVEDTGVSRQVAETFMEDMRADCVGAYDPLRPVQAIKVVYADHLSRAKTLPAVSPMVSPAATGGAGDHLLYKLFDGSRTLLYVGITSRGPQRLVEHHRTKSWFGDVEHILFERFTTRQESVDREAFLIRELHPLFNVQHNGRFRQESRGAAEGQFSFGSRGA